MLYTGGVDYASGPYTVLIKEGDMSGDLCINMIDDNMREMNEDFDLRIDATTLGREIVLMHPTTSTVTIEDDECTLVLCIMIVVLYVLL